FSLDLPCVDPHHRVEELDRVGLLPLEGVPAHDRAEAAPVADTSYLLEDILVALRGPAREDHYPAAVERALDHMTDALGDRADGDPFLLVVFLRLRQLDRRARHFHLDPVRAELCRDVRGVGDDVDGGLAFLAETRAARVRPYDDGEPDALRLRGDL